MSENTSDWPWFISTDEELWHEGGDTKAQAMALGLSEGGPFFVGQGCYKTPWPKLFSDIGDLVEYINDSNEECVYEDAFCDEAGLSNADIEPLLAKINAAWAEFLAQHKPTSRGMLIINRERVAGEPTQ